MNKDSEFIVQEIEGFQIVRDDLFEGGTVAGKARKDLEIKSGKKVATSSNYLPKKNDSRRLK